MTALVSLPWRTAGYYFGSWETILGFWTWTEYVEDGTDHHYVPLIQAIANHTPTDAKLLLILEHRSLYLPRRCVIGTPFFQSDLFTPPEPYSDPDRILQVLSDHRFTHVVAARSALGPDHGPRWWSRIEPLLHGLLLCEQRGRLTTLWQSEDHIVFTVQR